MITGMSKLPSAEEIYHRIRWDPELDGHRFTIGIEDRALGIQEVPFSSYVEGGDIPFHRIQYFRCGDTVIWDRRSRIDRLASLRQTSGSPAEPTTLPRRSSSPLAARHDATSELPRHEPSEAAPPPGGSCGRSKRSTARIACVGAARSSRRSAARLSTPSAAPHRRPRLGE